MLIVDEAQNLSPKALESLRILSNVNTQETLLQMILIGQPEFLETLKRPDLRQLNQRIAVFYKLDPLSEEETSAYIAHRLEVAGGSADVFSSDAIAMIWQQSGGIARSINTLCDLALVYGYCNGKSTIDANVVMELLADRRELAVTTEPTARAGRKPEPPAAMALSIGQPNSRRYGLP